MVGEEYLATQTQTYQEEEKSPFKRIIGINFLIFLIYYILFLTVLKLGGPRIGGFIVFLYPLQVITNFIAGIVYAIKRDHRSSSAFFLSALIILIVGFGACFVAVMGGI